MKEIVDKCYCDILAEHDNQRVDGAKTYKDVSVLVQSDNGTSYMKEISIDMCDACKAKYAPNLKKVYDETGNFSYVFDS